MVSDGSRSPAGELILPFPERIVPARHLRSTILVQSVDNLKSDGFYEKWLTILPPAHHAAIVGAVAGTWIPIEAALSHYVACESLGLNRVSQVATGRRTVERTATSLVGTALRLAQQTGTTPWEVIPHFHRFWPRGFDGGGVAVYKQGTKDALLHVVQLELLTSPYFRNAFNGFVSGLIALFCHKVYLSDRPAPAGAHSAAFQIQWV